MLRYLMGYGNLNQPTAFTGPQNPLNVPYLDTPEPQSPWSGGQGLPTTEWARLRARLPASMFDPRLKPQSPWDQLRPGGAQNGMGGSGGGGAFPQMPTSNIPGAQPAPGGRQTGGLTPGRIDGSAGGPNINVGQTPPGAPAAPGGNLQTQRLEQFFGQLGMPPSALQQQAVGNIGTFLSDANSPFNRTQQQSFDVLGNILGSNPGQPVIDALQPSFQRNLAEANQQGGRFGTANAVLRSRALDDFNLLAAQAAQQGVNQQMQAANLGNILGNDQLARLAGIFGIGGQQAQQADVETQRRIQLLQSLMATAQGAAFGQPVSVQPSGAQQGLQAGLQFAGILPFLLNRGG